MLLAWTSARLDPSGRTWIEAIGAEMYVINGKAAQPAWAAGGLRLLWSHRRRDMAQTARFWLWASCHGLVLSFIVLTSAVTDAAIVPVTLRYCVVAGFMTGLWTGRAEVAGIAGGTAALICACALFVTIGVTHWGSLNMPLLFVVGASAATVLTLGGLGFIAGAVGGAIASPLEAGRALGRAAADGPAWRWVEALRRMGPPHGP